MGTSNDGGGDDWKSAAIKWGVIGSLGIGVLVLGHKIVDKIFGTGKAGETPDNENSSKTEAENIRDAAVKETISNIDSSPGTTPEFVNKHRTNLENEPRLLFDTFIPKNSFSFIVADSGVGKTYLSIKMAENKEIDKVLYFTWGIREYSGKS